MKVEINEIAKEFTAKSENYSDALRLRLHRAISWLKQAEARHEDLDFCFISLWISFNAIYADELHTLGERSNFRSFLTKIWRLDSQQLLNSVVWETFSDNIRILLGNKFAFQAFWDEQNNYGTDNTDDKWKTAFESENNKAKHAIAKQQIDRCLHIVFRRLYTVRNQIMHGGATYCSRKNKAQKKDACTFLLNILPIIVKIMMDNHNANWGKPYYPVIE